MGLIDPEELLELHNDVSLRERSEAYFRQASDWTYLQGKPFMDPIEAATISGHLAGMFSAARLEAEMVVLDFGAGTGWLSRLLCQLSCHVISIDVSEQALKIGQELFSLNPPLRGQKELMALTFNGRKLPLRSGIFDRVLVMDAFHHVMDFGEVMDEFHRVLKPGGMVVMVEPGPSHSRTEQSQYEMREFGVPERDIDIVELDRLARGVGFCPLKCGIYSGAPFFVGVDDFEDEKRFSEVSNATARHFLENHRLIVLSKFGELRSTVWNSQSSAEIRRLPDEDRVILEIRNTGESCWLSIPGTAGHIRLGVRWMSGGDVREAPIEFLESGATVQSGSSVLYELPRELVMPATEGLVDVVAEGMFWFSENATQ